MNKRSENDAGTLKIIICLQIMLLRRTISPQRLSQVNPSQLQCLEPLKTVQENVSADLSMGNMLTN